MAHGKSDESVKPPAFDRIALQEILDSGKTPYEALGVEKSATQIQIKKAYHQIARSGAHPDRGGDSEAFQLIGDAYDLLKTEDVRKTTDDYIKANTDSPAETVANVVKAMHAVSKKTAFTFDDSENVFVLNAKSGTKYLSDTVAGLYNQRLQIYKGVEVQPRAIPGTDDTFELILILPEEHLDLYKEVFGPSMQKASSENAPMALTSVSSRLGTAYEDLVSFVNSPTYDKAASLRSGAPLHLTSIRQTVKTAVENGATSSEAGMRQLLEDVNSKLPKGSHPLRKQITKDLYGELHRITDPFKPNTPTSAAFKAKSRQRAPDRPRGRSGRP